MNITDHFSPNAHARSSKVDTIVLHYTDMLSAKAAMDLLCGQEAKVSAHYLIAKTGEIYRLVPEDKVAYHAGVSSWRGIKGLNETSIGIEIDNYGHIYGPEPFPDIQIKALIDLLNAIRSRHLVDNHHIVAHSDIAPERKKDPGELFPWDKLSAAGHGIWVPSNPADMRVSTHGMVIGEALKNAQTLLSKIGYDISQNGLMDTRTKAVITAFQRHFLPLNITGELDYATEKHIQKVAAKF